MVNGVRDLDMHDSLHRESAIDLTLWYLNQKEAVHNREFVSEVWVTSNTWDDKGSDKLTGNIEYVGLPIFVLQGTGNSKFEVPNSYRAISSAMSRSLGSRLAPSEFVTSIVIPVLNEVTKLEALFQEIELHTHSLNGSLLEFIFVDGGSIDGSREKLLDYLGSVMLDSDGSGGRQAAITHGIELSRGSTVGIFHADLEYSLTSFMQILGSAERSDGTLFIASRSHGAGSEFNLRRVYGKRNPNYWIARTGGIAVAALLSLRIGRVISDPFSGIYAGSREILVSHSPLKGDISGFIRTIRSCSKSGIPLVEMGITYTPRKRQDGKKTGVSHGFRALISAII